MGKLNGVKQTSCCRTDVVRKPRIAIAVTCSKGTCVQSPRLCCSDVEIFPILFNDNNPKALMNRELAGQGSFSSETFRILQCKTSRTRAAKKKEVNPCTNSASHCRLRKSHFTSPILAFTMFLNRCVLHL